VGRSRCSICQFRSNSTELLGRFGIVLALVVDVGINDGVAVLLVMVLVVLAGVFAIGRVGVAVAVAAGGGAVIAGDDESTCITGLLGGCVGGASGLALMSVVAIGVIVSCVNSCISAALGFVEVEADASVVGVGVVAFVVGVDVANTGSAFGLLSVVGFPAAAGDATVGLSWTTGALWSTPRDSSFLIMLKALAVTFASISSSRLETYYEQQQQQHRHTSAFFGSITRAARKSNSARSISLSCTNAVPRRSSALTCRPSIISTSEQSATASRKL
jgi:hypothetical protein